MKVVEVVARFAGTILDVAYLGPDRTYRIGTAPGVDLAVPGLASFPLVDGDTIRTPVGWPTRTRGETTELAVGALVIAITRTTLPPPQVPRRRWELRMPLFVLASLVAHVLVWLAAELHAPLERMRQTPHVRLARLVEKPPPPPLPERAPERAVAAAAATSTRRMRAATVPRSERVRPARDTSPSVASAIASLAKSFDDTRVVERVNALTPEGQYHEGDEYAGSFGTGGRFDPSEREGFESVQTGRYATRIYDVKLCPKRSCAVVGPVPPLYVRTHLHHHMDAIYGCYTTYATGPGTIVLEFTITGDGGVRDVRGSGLGETGACAARVVADHVFFRAFGRDTHVRYPVQFK